MFIQVRLLKGFNQPLWYEVPETWNKDHLMGTFVRVPIRHSIASALITHVQQKHPDVPFALRQAHSQENFPHDQQFHQFLHNLSHYYQIDSISLFKRLRSFLKKQRKSTAELVDAIEEQHQHKTYTLTQAQHDIVADLIPHLDQATFFPTLLHGITGSGKTEIYKELIKENYRRGKTTLLLLPEVTLALNFQQRLKHELPDIKIHGFHSGSSAKEKKLLWRDLLANTPQLIIGVHMPVLLPISSLGAIIVDEEHEVGYQEKKHPKINTKEAALMRAQLYNIPIVLGSATPSLATLHTARARNWKIYQLTERFSGSLPTISHVQLIKTERRRHFWISNQLYQAIEQRLERKEQTILFLNRRGYAHFVQCMKCGFIPRCNQCSVSLTVHDMGQLSCHYCGSYESLFNTCPHCKAGTKDLFKRGVGTQQLVEIVGSLFPTARIVRADMDTTRNKKQWKDTIEKMHNREIDILIGTQTITKGLDFAGVTLVGIVWADSQMNIPMYNSYETTVQQLIQVAGRAGRHYQHSNVIIQTVGPFDLLPFITETSYPQLYERESQSRKQLGYPPFKRFVEIELKSDNADEVKTEALTLAHQLMSIAPSGVIVLGPTQPLVFKIKHQYSYKIFIKAEKFSDVIALWQKIDKRTYRSSIFFTPNPLR